MIEIYANIDENFRKRVEFMFEMALLQKNHFKAAQVLVNFLKTCNNEEEQDYASFVFYTKMMERLNNENNNN